MANLENINYVLLSLWLSAMPLSSAGWQRCQHMHVSHLDLIDDRINDFVLVLSPKSMNCSEIDMDVNDAITMSSTTFSSTRSTKLRANRTAATTLTTMTTTTFVPNLKAEKRKMAMPKFTNVNSTDTYTNEYGRSVLTDVRQR